MEQNISREMELRKVPVSIAQNIAQELGGDDSILSLLMGNIVKDLDDPSSELRFTSRDIDAIRSQTQKPMNQILILIDEWGTMGRNRPKVYHLLNLLIRCQLFRAAEYVAQLMGESLPERPADGPAARVDIALSEDVENLVNGLDYPFSSNAANRNQPDEKPSINAPNMNFASETLSIPLIIPSTSSRIFNGQSTANVDLSNLIKFSTAVSSQPSTSQADVPTSQPIMPALTDLQTPDPIPMDVNSEGAVAQSEKLPAFSVMLNQETQNQSDALPAVLSALEIRSESEVRNDAATFSMPAFSQLVGDETSHKNTNRSSPQSSASSMDSDDD